MITVVALGGNALLRRGEPPEAAAQEAHVREAAAALAQVIAPDSVQHGYVITHGNGPQVGLLAVQSQADEEVAPYPLDLLDAETEGMIGYLLERELRNQLPGREMATLLTQVEVARDDPAFAAPDKPIGRVYDEQEGARLAERFGWTFAREAGGLRRVVASPLPRAIFGLEVVRHLLTVGCIVVCAGGGGIPVVREERAAGETPRFQGVEAVIDKDLVSARLAAGIGASRLWLLTDVDAAYENFGAPDARPYARLDTHALESLRFAPGSMGPKVEAACNFVAETGGEARIGQLEEVGAIARGEAGTLVVRGATAD